MVHFHVLEFFCLDLITLPCQSSASRHGISKAHAPEGPLRLWCYPDSGFDRICSWAILYRNGNIFFGLDLYDWKKMEFFVANILFHYMIEKMEFLVANIFILCKKINVVLAGLSSSWSHISWVILIFGHLPHPLEMQEMCKIQETKRKMQKIPKTRIMWLMQKNTENTDNAENMKTRISTDFSIFSTFYAQITRIFRIFHIFRTEKVDFPHFLYFPHNDRTDNHGW